MILPFIRTYKKTFILFFLFIATLLYFLYKYINYKIEIMQLLKTIVGLCE